MGKQINGTMRLTPPNGMSRDCRVSLYTDEEISGGGSVVVNSVPTDLSSYSVGQSISVPNSDGTSYTAYVVVESSGTKKLIKNSGSSTQVIDSLDSTSSSAALSANQGNVLSGKVSELSLKITDIESEIGDIDTALGNILGTTE